MQIDYFDMCRVGFELFMLKFLSLWLLKLYQFKYIFKQFVFALINLALYTAFNWKAFKLRRLTTLPYIQCLLFPIALVSINNFLLHNYIPLLLISTFQCFWLRQNFRKLRSPLFIVLCSFSLVRLFFSLPGYALYLLILSQCVLYLVFQVTQKGHIFSLYVFFSQVVVFLVSLVSEKYSSILDFGKFHVFARNFVFSYSIDSLFVNVFYHVVLFFSGIFCISYLISMEQGEKFRVVNVGFCLVTLLHFVYRVLHFLFLDVDKGVSNFNVFISYCLEYDTILFVLLCCITTIVIFVVIGLSMRYSSHTLRFRTTSRKWLHLQIMLFVYYAFYLKREKFLALLLSLVIVIFVYMELFRINNLLYAPVARFLTDIYKCMGHDSQVDKFEVSTISMLSGVLIPILFELNSDRFDWVRGGLGLFTVGLGDSMASVVGSKYPGNSYNNKSLQGTVAFFLSCLGLMVFTSFFQYGVVSNLRKMMYVSLFTSVFEYVSKEEDNVSVPLLAVLMYRL